MTKKELLVRHAFLAGSYTAKGKKMLTNYGGNFWGINRKRCTLIPAPEIELLIKNGLAEKVGHQLKVLVPETATPARKPRCALCKAGERHLVCL